MAITMTCRFCGETLTADDEDGLVREVQMHTSGHPGIPPLSREHILSRLRRLERHNREDH